MGLIKGRHNIRWKTVGGIAGSWITTPLFACLISFVCLFIVQNVFQQKVFFP
jgi:PiT family inorganic phosphate transporter